MRLKQLFCLALVTAFLPAATAQMTEELRLTVGKSIVLDYAGDIRQISTSDPAIVDAVAVSTREVLLHAKATGVATVIVWPQSGQRSIYAISVEQNLDPLRRLLKETFPSEDIQVQSSRDSLSLTGPVSSKDIADRAIALATPFAKTIVNNLRVAVAPVDKQILLRVKFAELNRSVGQSFAVNLVSTGAAGIIGGSSTGQFSPPRIGELNGGVGSSGEGARANFSISDALNVFAFRPELNLGTFIRALESEGVLQILAEPNLVTTTGKEASFLVGGEFPIPVLQAGASSGAITIQFREFGIRLTFNPVVTGNNTIKMHVKPEVSTVDFANALTVSGFLVPALATRRMETNIELGEGQSFVIGGLIDDRVTSSMNKIPGLANIPLLGALFKSREERKNHTELVVIVTPEITRPLQPGETPPTPVMPREFLQPVVPAAANRGRSDDAVQLVKKQKKGSKTDTKAPKKE